MTDQEDDVDSRRGTFLLASHRDVRRARSLRTRAPRRAAPRSRVLRRRRGSCARRPAARTGTRSGAPPTHGDVPSLPGGCRRPSTAECTTAWRPAAAGRTSRRSATGGVERFEPSALQSPIPRPSETRSRALSAFHRAASVRSPHGRAMAFATLGAADVLTARPATISCARALLLDGVSSIAPPQDDRWPWPEPRLRYANAALPEALLAAGAATDNPRVVARGLSMLRFLVDVETSRGHLSVTGTDGRGPAQRSAAIRPAADRGRGHRRCLRARLRPHRRVRRGAKVSRLPGHGSRVTTTPPPPCSTLNRAPDSMGSKRTGATRTAERSRRSRRSAPTSRLGTSACSSWLAS